jgi:hypothetical protein
MADKCIHACQILALQVLNAYLGSVCRWLMRLIGYSGKLIKTGYPMCCK